MIGWGRRSAWPRLAALAALACVGGTVTGGGPGGPLPLGRALAQADQPAASTPTAAVARLNDALLELMKTAGAVDARTRLARFQPVLRDVFDLEGSLRIATVPYYRRASEAERRALLDAFARRSAAQYVGRFDAFSGQSFAIDGERPGPSGTTIVATRIVRPEKEPVVLNYVLRRSKGRWGVLDVLLNGTVSQLATQRSEYARTLREGGVGALTDTLNADAERQLAG